MRMNQRNRLGKQRPGTPWRLGLIGACLAALFVPSVLSLASPPVAPAVSGAPAPTSGRVIVVPIDSEINDIMLGSIQRRVDPQIYEEDRDGIRRADAPAMIIFEIKTWGGLVTSAVDINQYIRNLPPEIKTVAYVNDRAISAGSMIAVGCDEIWMTRSSQIGDSAPISATGELDETTRAKVESIVLQTFRGSSQENGYPELLTRAMVSVGVEVWVLEKIEPDENGEREMRFATTEEKRELLGEAAEDEDEPSTLSRLFDREEKPEAEWRLVDELPNPIAETPISLRQPLDSDTELLTLNQSEAVALGFAHGIAADLDDLATALGVSPGQMEIFDRSTWDLIAEWLNSPVVRGVLFLVMLMGGYIEFQSPGLILPGTVALIAAILFFGAPYALGFADIWIFVVLAIGLILIGIEIFLLPGFGVFGILGLAALATALIATFIPPALEHDGPWWTPNLPTSDRIWDGVETAIMVLSSGLIASVVGLLLLAKYLPQTSMSRYLIPGNPEQVTLEPYQPQDHVAQVGDVGEVVHPLKPSGQARFGNEMVEVSAPGEYIEPGVKVQVIRREGMTAIVRALRDEA